MRVRKKVYLIIQVLLLALVFTGCKDVDSTMPGVIFVQEIRYPVPYTTNHFTLSFYDKEGNYYVSSDDPSELLLSPEELVNEYNSGKLVEHIKYVSSCDKAELSKNYRKLCKLGKNSNYELIPPVEGLQVESSVITWYGLYYKNGELQSIPLYKGGMAGVYIPNDKQATEIYEWIIGTLEEADNTL